MFWIVVSVTTMIGLAAAGTGNSFHDFLGGRFPVADGFDWLKASLDAASGDGTDYGVRRPWNLPFNVFSLWAGHRIGQDPLLSSLAKSTIRSWGSIVFSSDGFLFGLAICGSLSIIAFQVPFLREAGLRPSVPYCGFPLMLLVAACDKGLALVLRQHGRAEQSSELGNLFATAMSLIFLTHLAMGMFLIQRETLLSAGYGWVNGAIQARPVWLQSWMSYEAISPSMRLMYRFRTSPDLAPRKAPIDQQDDPLCVRYRRRGFPWGLPYGELSVARGPCQP